MPRYVFDTAKVVTHDLTTHGIGKLPKEVIRPTRCPRCGGELEVFEAKYRYVRCTRCEYMQQDFSTVSNFGLGVLVGLGLAALIYLLFKNSEKEA